MSNQNQSESALVAQNVKTVQHLLESNKVQIAKALPKHLTADRMQRIALTEIRRNPMLAKCEAVSILGSVIQAAQVGLEIGSVLGHAYLVPYWNNNKKYFEAQFIPGYRGFMELARRSGAVKKMTSRAVYSKEKFEVEYGFEERLIHIPILSDAR